MFSFSISIALGSDIQPESRAKGLGASMASFLSINRLGRSTVEIGRSCGVTNDLYVDIPVLGSNEDEKKRGWSISNSDRETVTISCEDMSICETKEGVSMVLLSRTSGPMRRNSLAADGMNQVRPAVCVSIIRIY